VFQKTEVFPCGEFPYQDEATTDIRKCQILPESDVNGFSIVIFHLLGGFPVHGGDAGGLVENGVER